MKTKRQKGAAVVEFAVILPLLLLILFGIVEFGFLLYNQAMLTNASREGARAGIVAQTPRRSTAYITGIVNNYTANFLVNFKSGTDPVVATTVKVNDVEADPSSVGMVSAEDYLTVELSYDYHFLLIDNLVSGIGINKTLHASSTMRAE